VALPVASKVKASATITGQATNPVIQSPPSESTGVEALPVLTVSAGLSQDATAVITVGLGGSVSYATTLPRVYGTLVAGQDN
jgi:hypothetical protein